MTLLRSILGRFSRGGFYAFWVQNANGGACASLGDKIIVKVQLTVCVERVRERKESERIATFQDDRFCLEAPRLELDSR